MLCAAACGAHSLTAGFGAGGASTASAPPATGAETSSGPPAAASSEVVDCSDPQSVYFKSRTANCKPPEQDEQAQSVYGPDGRLDKRAEGRHQWTVLEGYTVEEARQRARAAGYKGEIKVAIEGDYNKDCRADTVCWVDPPRWEFNLSDPWITLRVNPKVKLSSPD